MTIQQLYPTTRPSLDLNFARTKRLDPRVTFTRGSTATYVGSDGLIKTAVTNEARFDHDPATGESLGLLVEEARTNYVTDNNQVLLAVTNSTTSSAPGVDGVATSGSRITSIAAGVASARNATNRTIFWPNSSYTVWSFYVKPENTTATSITLSAVAGSGAGGATFDWSTLTTTINGANALSASIKAMGNGWYYCSVNYNNTLSGTTGYRMEFTFTAGGAGDTVSLYGNQVEVGSFPTSYIPTSGSTVTRSADVASMTGTNFSSWYNQEAGSFIAKQKTFATTDYRTVFTMSVGGTNYNGVDLGYHTNNWMTWSVRKLGQQKKMGPPGPGVPYKIKGLQLTTATSYDNATASAYISDPGSTVTDAGFTASTTPPVTMSIGYSSPYSNSFLCGHILRLTYYPTRLTDVQLQAITL